MRSEWVEIAADRRGFAVAAADRDDELAAFKSSTEYAAIDHVWNAHQTGMAPDKEVCATVAKLPSQLLRLYLLHIGAFDRIVKPFSTDKVDVNNALHTSAGERLGAWLHHEGSTYGERCSHARFVTDDARSTVIENEVFCRFQDEVFRTRELTVPSYFLPGSFKCRDSFHTFGRGVYMFRGDNPFYLITGGAGHKALAFYHPMERTIIDLQAGVTKVLTPDVMATTFATQVQRLARNHQAFAECIRTAEDNIRKTTIVLMAGQIENFAHHLWNFFPALERLIENGDNSNVDEVWSLGTEFFGSLTEIFPEFKGKHTYRARAAVHSLNPFDPSTLLFQAGGYFIPDSLQTRVLNHCARTMLNSEQCEPETCYIWFGLRVGSRSWADQISAIPELMEKVLEFVPNAVFILDGFSFAVGKDEISSKWVDTISKLKLIAAEIERLAPRDSRIINLVGRPLNEAVVYAHKTAVYITPLGSTQHKVGWFSRGKGIIYSGASITSVRPTRRPGCWEAESILLPSYIIGRTVSSGILRSLNDQRVNLENIRLDIEELTSMLLSVLPVYPKVDVQS